jgi:hypothetical protein
MGFFRGGLLVIVSILLFLTLLLGNIFLILSMSLQYDNVRDALVPLIREFVEDQSDLIVEDFNLTDEMEEAQEVMQDYCKNNTDYIFSEGGYTFVVPCELANETPETLFEEGIDTIVEQTYYKEYDCGFWDCFGQEELPFFLISEKARDYWKEKFYFAIVASLILVVLIFFLVAQKQNFPILFGGLLAVSSLPLLKLDSLTSVIGGDATADFTSFFFSSSSGIFWTLFIIGLVILGLGIAWRILTHDSIKKKLSKKDVRQIVKSTKK